MKLLIIIVLVFSIFYPSSSYSIELPDWIQVLFEWYHKEMISNEDLATALQFFLDNKAENTFSETLGKKEIEFNLTLNDLPKIANTGQKITFSGSVSFENGSSEGRVVYIKDFDVDDPDDLLATTVVDNNDRFEVAWNAHATDREDNSIEVYAVLEGRQNESATICSNCDELIIFVVDENIELTRRSDSQYLSLHGAFWNKEEVNVLITTNSESQNVDEKYFDSVVEGTLIWQDMLKKRYPEGNWNINVTVEKEPVSVFDKTHYDILTVITRGSDRSCEVHYLGITDFGIFHNQGYITNMVSVSDPCNIDRLLPQEVVKTAAAHEIGHALGLEHAININNDLMCSNTCEKADPRALPSELDLKGIAHIYGEGGFGEPNRISIDQRGTKFFDGVVNNNIQDTEKQITEFSLYKNAEYGVSFEYPVKWVLKNNLLDLNGMDSIAIVSPVDSGMYAWLLSYDGLLGYNELSGEEYLEKLIADHRDFCEDYSFAKNGFRCSDYTVEIAEYSGQTYYMKANWKKQFENSQAEITTFLITIPDNNKTWKFLIEGNADSFERHHKVLQHIVSTFSL